MRTAYSVNMKTIRNSILFIALLLKSMFAHGAIISGDHRFSLNGGLIHLNNPNQTSFSVSAEYEYKLMPIFGIGGQGSYIFADNAITQLALPGAYLHPLAGDWYVSASPVFYLQSGADDRVGARFTTYMPLALNIMTLTPVFGVDVIKGGPNYLFGLGLSI